MDDAGVTSIAEEFTMIQFEKLSINFGEHLVIKDFSGQITENEFVVMLGPNGAGKSTLLRTILGLVKPNAGQIRVFNKKVCRGDVRIGYLPQTRQAFSNNHLSGRARLLACVNGHRFGLPINTKQKKQRVNELIDLVGAAAYVDQPFKQLSGGERQRLLLVQALLNHPKILLLDEPLAGLDLKQQYRLIEIIQQLQKQMGFSVLLTAHDINPLLPVVEKVIYLASGHCAIGKPKDVINSQTLSQLYGTKIEVIEHDQHLLVYNAMTKHQIGEGHDSFFI